MMSDDWRNVQFVLPASAGMILEDWCAWRRIYSAPRIRGDDPSVVLM